MLKKSGMAAQTDRITILKFNNITIISLAALLILAIAFAAVAGAADYITPDKISYEQGQPPEGNSLLKYQINVQDSVEAAAVLSPDGIQILDAQAKLFGLIPIKKVTLKQFPKTRLCAGGVPFGVKLFTKGVIVVGIGDVDTSDGVKSPAGQAGIRVGDIITKLNGRSVNSIEEVTAIIESNRDKKLTLEVERGKKSFKTDITPVLSVNDKKYKSGVWVRDSTAGIGTVTFINPETGEFAGLGHGICDIDTGELMPLKRGIMCKANIIGVTPGRRDYPGELRGSFGANAGVIYSNTAKGIFGIYNTIPSDIGETYEVGLSDKVHAGPAQIFSTVDGSKTQRYNIEIVKIYKSDIGVKNFLIRVTDPVLLEKTGGIVQGMSGSPIIQDGLLVGAVTHVLVGDPSKGYGIFIENMLSEMANVR